MLRGPKFVFILSSPVSFIYPPIFPTHSTTDHLQVTLQSTSILTKVRSHKICFHMSPVRDRDHSETQPFAQPGFTNEAISLRGGGIIAVESVSSSLAPQQEGNRNDDERQRETTHQKSPTAVGDLPTTVLDDSVIVTDDDEAGEHAAKSGEEWEDVSDSDNDENQTREPTIYELMRSLKQRDLGEHPDCAVDDGEEEDAEDEEMVHENEKENEDYREEGTEGDHPEESMHVFSVHRKYQHNTYEVMEYPGEVRKCGYCFVVLPDTAARCVKCLFPMCERCKWRNPRMFGGPEPAPHIRAEAPDWVKNEPLPPPPETAPDWMRATNIGEFMGYVKQQIESGEAERCMRSHFGEK